MSTVKISLFSQILKLIDRDGFAKLVRHHDSDHCSKGINSWTHLVTMLFMHLSGADSLRDISNGLRSATGNLSHMGVGRAPSRSSISYLNGRRDAALFEDLYMSLLEKYEPSMRIRRAELQRLKKKIFLLDSTTIPLCLELFDWARFRTRKGAVKMHAVLNMDIGLPAYVLLTEGRVHDKVAAEDFELCPDSVCVMDRAYVDFERLRILDSTGVHFVTRAKSNMAHEIVDDHDLGQRPGDIIADRRVRLTGPTSSVKYPHELRMVHLWDDTKKKKLVFLTNQMEWSPKTIAALYRSRWDVEIFFKHIKQLLCVRSFVGTSENAVRIQLWTALIAMLLLKYLAVKAAYRWNLSNLATFLRINLFVKIDLYRWLDDPIVPRGKPPPEWTLF